MNRNKGNYVIKFPFVNVGDPKMGVFNFLKSTNYGRYGEPPCRYFELTNNIDEADKFSLDDFETIPDIQELKQFAFKLEEH